MNLLPVAVCVMTVIAQLRRSCGLRLGNIPTGRVVEDDLRPAAILRNGARDTKLPTVRQQTHRSFVVLPNQHRKRLVRIRLVQINECWRSLRTVETYLPATSPQTVAFSPIWFLASVDGIV